MSDEGSPTWNNAPRIGGVNWYGVAIQDRPYYYSTTDMAIDGNTLEVHGSAPCYFQSFHQDYDSHNYEYTFTIRENEDHFSWYICLYFTSVNGYCNVDITNLEITTVDDYGDIQDLYVKVGSTWRKYNDDKGVRDVWVDNISVVQNGIAVINNKQDKLTAGQNINMVGNTISADLTPAMIAIQTKQDKLTAGDNIIIETVDGDVVISSKYNMEDYNRGEEMVGYWINGKPIYRQLLRFENTTLNQLHVDVSEYNIETLILLDGCIGSSMVSVSQCTLSIENNILTGEGEDYVSFIIIKHTKTSDIVTDFGMFQDERLIDKQEAEDYSDGDYVVLDSETKGLRKFKIKGGFKP